MEAGGRALAVRERGREDFDAGGEKGAELVEAGLVGAEALADQEGDLVGLCIVEPDLFSQTRSPASVVAGAWISAKVGMLFGAEGGLRVSFGDAGGLAGSHEDQAMVGRESRVVGVDGVEG